MQIIGKTNMNLTRKKTHKKKKTPGDSTKCGALKTD
jgi:hypothetical protein